MQIFTKAWWRWKAYRLLVFGAEKAQDASDVLINRARRLMGLPPVFRLPKLAPGAVMLNERGEKRN